MSTATPIPAYAAYEHFVVSAPAHFVAHVEINRPSKLNAFSQHMWLEFGRIFRQISEDADVRAVVLSGAGDRAFTSGLDVQAASQDGVLQSKEADVARKAKGIRNHILEFQDCVSEAERCEKPVICVLHGISIGLAIDISCCADMRICTSDVRLAVKEVDIGLAADIGTLARLPKIVGSASWVKDVCLTARNFSAQEALAVGFVSQVHEGKDKAVQAAVALAANIAEKSPVAVQGTKELLNYGRDHDVANSLRYTQVWNSAALQGKDFPLAIKSGLTKSKPRFEKL